jgi:hypothetical protein
MQYLPLMARQVTLPDTNLTDLTREGLWRVAGTRVSVDRIIHAFGGGQSEIHLTAVRRSTRS